ncbi:hypothetical protein K443DRAFT_6712 [Laccaria amethystina LaAM-08-1]|uniref:Unplaced genomic scaffold K443scaffold_68, whole genome shotgun sequence n=1 Tax=Laccaria amethystina LaAM-08-1 TaxID=1095629 RepID=A0A0C9X9G6_9AGAR|nr:hypothetical protein K443DRAFT_6712 [Laccaria amethystina LaAM-08-1]
MPTLDLDIVNKQTLCSSTTTTTIDDAHPSLPSHHRRVIATATASPPSTWGRVRPHPPPPTSPPRMTWQCHVTERTSAGHVKPQNEDEETRHEAHHNEATSRPPNIDDTARQRSPPDVLCRLTVTTYNIVTICIRCRPTTTTRSNDEGTGLHGATSLSATWQPDDERRPICRSLSSSYRCHVAAVSDVATERRTMTSVIVRRHDPSYHH